MTQSGRPGQNLPGLKDIYKARARIAGRVVRTPLVPSASLSDVAGCPVSLKLETMQPTGAFKLRGATNALLALDPEERSRGVVTCSTGNHGRAVAYAAKAAGVRAVICMSELVPRNKVEAVRALGAEVRIIGRSQDDAQIEADKLSRTDGLVQIPPFDHADVIAGQGTIGIEVLEELPEVATLLVPLSGGGLIAGIAAAVKGVSRSIRIVGISMERGAAMVASLAAGEPVEVVEEPTLADSLGGGIGLSNRYTYELVRDLVDEVVLLSEVEIAAGMRHLFLQDRIVSEGAGAVGVAAILARKLDLKGGPVATVISGNNVDMRLFLRIAGGEDVDLKKEAGNG